MPISGRVEDQKLRKAEDERPKPGNQKNIEPQTQGKVEIGKKGNARNAPND